MENVTKIDFVESIKARRKQFVLDSIKFYQALPKTEEGRIIGRQFIRSASSVGANYRAACRSRSRADFFSKLSILLRKLMKLLFGLRS